MDSRVFLIGLIGEAEVEGGLGKDHLPVHKAGAYHAQNTALLPFRLEIMVEGCLIKQHFREVGVSPFRKVENGDDRAGGDQQAVRGRHFGFDARNLAVEQEFLDFIFEGLFVFLI